jgi:DNA-binding GntR family transcriptional regulator
LPCKLVSLGAMHGDPAPSRATSLPARPISSRGIQERVVEAVRGSIISGEYAPGSSLSEVALAEAFAISRTPVREALKQLQVEGLVDIVPRVGTFVSQPSRRDVVELFQLKEILEGLAARLLAMRGRVPEVERLELNVRDSEAAVAADDQQRYAELVHEFHDLIVEGADQAKLAAHYRTLMNQLAYHRLVVASLQRPGRPDRSLAEHRAVLDRILDKDPHGAETAMRDHVQASHRALLAAMVDLDGANGTREDGAR